MEHSYHLEFKKKKFIEIKNNTILELPSQAKNGLVLTSSKCLKFNFNRSQIDCLSENKSSKLKFVFNKAHHQNEKKENKNNILK
jgi:hypothetical protein